MEIVDPATGEVFDRVREDTAETVAAKVVAARVAQPEWAARPLEQRVAILGRFRDLVVRHTEHLARTLTSETGKPITQSRNELAGLLPRLDFFLDAAPRVLAAETVLDDAPTTEVIDHEPLGVVANVSAWNYPYFVGSNVFVPALLAGNAVVYKPSEHATLTGLAIGSMLGDAGVPIDVFAVVMGRGLVGAELLGHPLDGAFFTGSYATGRRVAEAMAGQLSPVQLELGGKDPVYVCEDVDVAWSAAGLADGAFYNNGQSCCSVERLYVHDDVHDAFVDAFCATVDGFVMGDPNDDATYLGPLTRADQADVLEAQVADALAKGATLVRGGRRVAGRPGAWFEPTVLTDVSSDMAVMRDESFGPIIGIQRVSGDDDAVERMADTEFGLTAGVYTPDEQRARAILRRVDVGSAYWNCCDRVSPRLPWSGRGHSGLGTTLSTYGLLTFTRPRAWHLLAVSSGRQASRRTASPSG
jgi:acyl-CoA reductase-like NAD-dependent aldehyde dehydrogenase